MGNKASLAADLPTRARATDTSRRRQPNELCEWCSRLEVRAMLLEEKVEVKMGPLSEHLTPDCPFCNLISETIRQNWGPGWNSERLCAETTPVPRIFMQSRSPFSIKINGHIEHPQPRLLMAIDVRPPGYSENRRVIREVDRVKDRFIIAEIESVPGDYDDSQLKEASLVPRRGVGPEIDYKLVKTWLKLCHDHEHTLKAKELMTFEMFDSRNGFRLIDVEKQCLVLVKEACAFAALSYVWGRLPTVLQPGESNGQKPILLTTLDNLDKLSTPGGLSPEAIDKLNTGRLPQTIHDAMLFLRTLSMRYLWVDTLCIVQDDRKDKEFMIQSMDDVYDHAAVTLIAASGSNADAGLRGVSYRDGRPINSFTIIDDGITEHLSICPPSLGEEVRASVWNTRGWTFQEQALSQRCLYFTPEELFFNCIKLQWREAYALESIDPKTKLEMRTGPPWWNRKLRQDLDPTPYRYLGDLTGSLTMKDYQAAVQDYSRKTLSFPEDVLHAFEGVVNRFNKCTPFGSLSLEQTQGIPVHLFHKGLLWFPSEEAHRRICPNIEGARFSSWSWASWEGPVEFVFADSLWLSRNISYAPHHNVPMHMLILNWHYGGDKKTIKWQDVSKCTPQRGRPTKPVDLPDPTTLLQEYVQKDVGIDVDALATMGNEDAIESLGLGDVGFRAAYINASQVSLSAKGKSKRIHAFEFGDHHGEFRFDVEGSTEVDEFVAVLTADTITKPPDTESIFLGLVTVDGVSRRVGIGWVYYSRAESASRPPWEYKFFKLR
ncbi:unnamed protein product [Clonostachys rosea f. rosea IK726]|uniref:Heterokaryon incompatibility domain-containing protein n=2 Tax=Bionectria ochroleuca TaxID=29856 RepID=A0A0B7JGY8_BIOOC|nr:unnamed protein product [Clonostachys rosea f. rosea IK726]